MKEVVTEKISGVWRMKERDGEEEKEQLEAKQDHPLRLMLITKVEKLEE